MNYTRGFYSRICVLLFVAVISDAGAQQQSRSTEQQGLAEIVVTAQKRSESLVEVPISITALSEKTLSDYNVQQFTDYASKVPNLDFSVGGSGGVGLETSRVVEIRGMSGGGTTSLYIDDTPLPDTLDPAVVDLERIEVLRGPQGTLYGESSLGGNIRLISHRPSLIDDDLKYMVQSGWTESGTEPNYGGNVIGNLVVVPGRLAVRAMGVVNHDAGYITRAYPCTPESVDRCSTDGVGNHDTYGGSISMLWQASDRFSVDAKFLAQLSRYPNGLPVSFVEPPAYALSLTDNRAANGFDTSDFHWYLPAITLRYQGDGWNATSASAYFRSRLLLQENDTEGLGYLLQSGFGFTPGPEELGVPARADVEQFAEELRMTVDPIHNFSGIVGAFYKSLRSNFLTSAGAPGLGAALGEPDDFLYKVLIASPQTDKSVFGELYYRLFHKLTLTVGARDYWLTEENATIPLGGFLFTPTKVSVGEHGISPKYGLKYDISAKSSVYTSAAKGFRPGGGNLQPPPVCDPELASLGISRAQTLQFKSDDVWSYEIGGKFSFAKDRVLLTGAVFDIEWKGIQQAINLPSCGSIFTANSGAARNRGAELELAANPASDLSLRAGIGYVHAVITEGGGGSPLTVGAPVFNVPKVTANVGGIYTVRRWQDKEWLLTADASYVGSNFSGNTSGAMPIQRPAFYVLNASTALRWGNQRELSLYFKNLTNSKAFYGDLQPLSFGSNAVIDGVTYPIARARVSSPFQIGIQYRYGF